MLRVFHEPRLPLHALQHQPLAIRMAHSGYKEQRVQSCEVPRFQSLPHRKHRVRSQRHKVRECIVEEERLVLSVGVAVEVEPGLSDGELLMR